jgi:hypothetical protein
LSLVSPFMKSHVIQMNSILATDSIFKVNDTKTIKYLSTREVAAGPVDDDLSGGILVINYEASMDTTINIRTVYNVLDFISDVGGFVAYLLVITYALVTFWNAANLRAFLVSKIFEKKHTG